MFIFMILKFIFWMSISSLLLKRQSLLMYLMNLEFLMLVLSVVLSFVFYFHKISYMLLLLFLIIMVCEGAVGLSIMISLLRFQGVNFLNYQNLLKW